MVFYVFKALYGRLFSWLVNKANVCIHKFSANPTAESIGVLDIFGFECLTENG